MKILNVVQGSEQWHALRRQYYRTASRAPEIMGAGYRPRGETLAEIASGIPREITPELQALFDKGHAAEAAQRVLVEARLGAALPPMVAITDDGYLFASVDGGNVGRQLGWEHKLLNAKLVEQIKAKSLDPLYYWQLEHQCMVFGWKAVIFSCSDGTAENAHHMVYKPVPGRAEQLMAGWRQFDADLAAYKPVEVIQAVTATPVMALPALSIQVQGSISLIDNLAVFGEKLTAFIDNIDKAPDTDQGFADAEQAIKTLQNAQEALEREEQRALSQTATIDQMRRTVALYVDQARSTRLLLEKVVKTRKEQIRTEIVQTARQALAEHVAGLNKILRHPYMPPVAADFLGAIKGKKTLASLREAVDTELARCKIEASGIADRIQLNLIALREVSDYEFLFADAAQILLKVPEDFSAVVKIRIAEHREAETKRLEAERERIRLEEQAAAERKVREAEEVRVEAARNQLDVDVRAESQITAEREHNGQASEKTASMPVSPVSAAPVLDDLVRVLRARIDGVKKYAGIAKAIDAYFVKQEKRAA